MFAGVEILNESNYISKEQNESEIQMSLISHEEITTKSLSTTDSKNTKSKPKVGRKSDLGVHVKSCGNFPSPQPIAVFAEKEKWGKDIEFLLSCISLSVGLGNVWRFPFTALENGGGAFVLPYIIVLNFVGKPLYYMELLLGQFSSRGCIKVYDMSPAMRGVGIGQVIATCFVTTYYASLMALTIRYFLASFNDPLPWTLCSNNWTDSCVVSNSTSINGSQSCMSCAEHYFVREILNEADSIHEGIGTPSWELCLCLIFAWACISGILIKGIKSSGKASYFLALFPYAVMIVLLVRSATLDGAIEGMLYFIRPQWDKLLDAKVWYAAVTQVFYSLAVCFGSVIMYSSYNRFDQNIYKDVNIITALDTSTSLLAGFIVFGILGHLAHLLGVDIKEVTSSNTALAFIAYPETIARINFCPQFFSMMFFIMLFVLGIGSNIGMASCIVTVIRDKFPQIAAWKVVLGIAFVGITVGSIYTTPCGQYLIVFLDFYAASFVALVLAIVELITVSWIYGVDRFCDDIEFMLKKKTGLYWRICWGIITPASMFAIFFYFVITWTPLTYQGRDFPTVMTGIGWCISSFCLLQVPLWMIVAISKQKQKTWSQKFFAAFEPSSSWGPNNSELMLQYQEFLSKRNAKRHRTSSLLKKIKNKLFG